MNKLISYDTGHQYVLTDLLGQGGFGKVFKAFRQRGRRSDDAALCVKITSDVESWHREAYFGEVLRNHPGAVQMDCTLVGQCGTKHPLYCTVFELAVQSVFAGLRDGGFGWTESRVLAEFIRVT